MERPIVNAGQTERAQVSGVPAEIKEAPAAEPETQWQQMRIERARELLGWAPGADLTDGVRELWAHITDDATTANVSPA